MIDRLISALRQVHARQRILVTSTVQAAYIRGICHGLWLAIRIAQEARIK